MIIDSFIYNILHFVKKIISEYASEVSSLLIFEIHYEVIYGNVSIYTESAYLTTVNKVSSDDDNNDDDDDDDDYECLMKI